jgi:hypothetical protein
VSARVSNRTVLRRCTSVLIAAVLYTALFSPGATSAYALGIQSHTTNGYAHGCPLNDIGCPANTSQDYVRRTYQTYVDDGNSAYMALEVRYKNGYLENDLDCSNCWHLHIHENVYPSWECAFYSWHYASGPTLSGHNHWTGDAIC